MKSILFLFVMFFLTISLFSQSEEIVTKFDPSRSPDSDLKAAVELAKNTNKRIILDVGGEWCIWCHRIDAFMHNTNEIKSLIEENYIFVKINYSKENKNEKFLSQYPQVEGYPHFFMLDENGKILHSQNTGELEKDKDYDKEKFIAFLNKWKPNKN
ncbi:MAG: thioredoxin family protein [Ignavibacteria bacterium]|nr:thioredoxin family protein [Ignavibacteria bacterium]